MRADRRQRSEIPVADMGQRVVIAGLAFRVNPTVSLKAATTPTVDDDQAPVKREGGRGYYRRSQLVVAVA